MSWFNAAQLSSFAKQALSQAQKSIDRVLDIQEDPHAWAGAAPYGEPGGSPAESGGWDVSSWGLTSGAEPQSAPSASPKAITKPVRRTVVDESENFFSAFLSAADVQSLEKRPVVSTPPAKSQRPEERVPSAAEEEERSRVAGPPPAAAPGPHEDAGHAEPGTRAAPPPPKAPETGARGQAASAGAPRAPPPLAEQKAEDRQSDTPSPPASTFSSGTSTTSDIEVLDHESVLSESSASSRQEAAEAKAGLALGPAAFQLLSASASADDARLDGFPKLQDSCGSSDAFERIDSFSVQSLDSRSVSEINSDDELPGRACAPPPAAPAAPGPGTPGPDSADCAADAGQGMLPAQDAQADVEESRRSTTPVNCEPEPEPPGPASDSQEGQEDREERSGLETADQAPAAHGQPEAPAGPEQETLEFLNEKLEKREAQLLSLSKEKAALEEAYDNLKDEMSRVKEASGSVSSLRDEFTHRIAEAERRAQLACKERDAARKEVKNIKEELASRLNSSQTAELLKEKEEQIQGLLEEGEKLSKQQLHNSNTIKKLRNKDKEKEGTIAKLSRKAREQEEELRHLRQVLDGKEEVEKQHRESIKKLSSVVERQEKELGRLQGDLDGLEEKSRSAQAALDGAYRELSDLHKANAAKDSEAQEAALGRERRAKEELRAALEEARQEARQQQEALALQVGDLRLALQRAEQAAARKEDYLRQEVSELQQRLQEAESRNQELSQSVSATTRPLLRQLEHLQAALGARASSWDELEKSLSDRLGEAQRSLAAAVERERAATEEALAGRTQLASLESQNALLRQEGARCQAQLEAERRRLRKLEEDNTRYQVELDTLKAEYGRALEDARKEKALLSSQLEMEKMEAERERKKAVPAAEASREKERRPVSVCSTPSLSRSSSLSGADLAGLQASLQEEPPEHCAGAVSVYEAVRTGAASTLVESLQSQLKLREGEVAHLQLEIGNLEKTRSIMAEELVKLTSQNDELEEKVKEAPRLRSQLRDLDQRYNTILQMYGEKAEEAEELRLDLEDVKSMYKSQIDELLRQRLS